MNPVNGRKIRFATVWLGGCSGCHMSFLDLDERLIELAGAVELVYGPFCDAKEFPAGVDVALVEGAVNNRANLEMAKRVRSCCRTVVSLGDCAITGNVTSMRNNLSIAEVLAPYREGEGAGETPWVPEVIPELLPRALPLHQVITVDGFIPGCPPDPDRIWTAIGCLLRGEPVHLEEGMRTFG